jgi:hypothetical protein
VVQVKERDGYYVLSLGQFTIARFRPVSAAEASYAKLSPTEPKLSVEPATAQN